MSGGALGRAAGSALSQQPSTRSVLASTFLLAGSQALGLLLEPTGVKRATFNDFSVSPGDASDTVSYIAGTVETVPHLISYFDFHSKKVKNDVSIAQMLIQAGLDGLAGYVAGGGTFGLFADPPTAYIGLAEGTILGAIVAGLGQLRTASYRYYCGFLYGICHGVIDSTEAVKVDERLVHNTSVAAGDQFLIDDPQAWGGDHVDGGVYVLCKAIPGNFWPTQQIDPYVATQLGANTSSWSGKALFLMYGFTGFPESGYFAATPQGSPAVRPLKLRVRRLPNNLGVPAYHNINGDANLAECAFEWLTSPTFGVKKLPLSKIDVASFQTAAQTLHTRGLGISLEMNADTDVETALDKFSALGDLIVYGSFNSGQIRCKVIERDYSIGSLPVFRRGLDGSASNLYNVVKVDGFTPGSWANTANDFSFDYIDRNNNYLKATRYAQDLANKMLTGRTRSLSQSLEGVSNGTTAALVGTRELRAGSYPRPPINLGVNRDGYALEPGDVIKYIDNVDNFIKILRIAEVQALATDSTAEVGLNCTEDQYGVGSAAFAPYVPPGFVLTLHLHFEVEDSLSPLSDALTKSLAVHTSASGSDSINFLGDEVSVQMNAPLSLSLSDSASNLVDALRTNFHAPDIIDPPVIGTELFWWKSSDITGLVQDDPISSWPSGLGTPNALVEASNRPVYKENILNGLPAAYYNSSNRRLISENAITGLRHVFILAKYDAATFDGFDGLINFTDNAESGILFTGDSGTNHWYYGSAGAGDDFRDEYKVNGVTDTAMTGPMNSFVLMENAFDWSAKNDTIVVGQDRENLDRYWNGYVVEMIGFSSELSAGDALSIRQYFYQQYELSGS